jgi:pyruvate ferredoxin oxidoreductase beta subunit
MTFDYTDRVLKPGYTSCLGCGEALAMRIVAQAAGPRSIFTAATGCSEIFTGRYPQSSWAVPWIHSLFENSAAVASGIYYALKHKGKLEGVNVIGSGGDGGTADIGLQCLSGAMERGDDILYVCWDNEAYMNTGIQRSSLTPLDASTTTSPSGKASWGNDRPKKDVPAIMAAHGIPYVAVGSCGYYRELPRLVKKALETRGPKYLQVHAVCPLGWRSDPAQSAVIARLAFETGCYPLYEIIEGEVKPRRPPKEGWKPVIEYLKPQGRFRHLFRSADGEQQVLRIQAQAARNIRKFWGAESVPDFAKEAEQKVAEAAEKHSDEVTK